MASKTAVTRLVRARKKSSRGKARKKKNRSKGTTPKFPIHG
ncbi:MAG TPA: hypothetical protein VL588_12400 [Bdellovibrionota bacterium]|jgi:hypothetical protein|nr:hypothetical protein [Bdellovibrionota bacterium]